MLPRLHARGIAVLALAALVLGGCDSEVDQPDDRAAAPRSTAAADTMDISVADAGFETPESILYDEDADVYLVSNINGAPLARDGNGFISRVSPGGSVEQLRWIDGAAEGLTLHAPKGMALKGDTLFVADIDSVRAFHRRSGEPLGARGVDGASFLNDLAVSAAGTLYVTDTGLDQDFSPTGTDAVHRFGEGGIEVVIRGTELSNPNGIAADGDALLLVGFGSNEVMRIIDGAAQVVARLPGGQLDGIVLLDDGSMLVSSWESGAVYRVGEGGDVEVAVADVENPADIGFDSRRGKVLIPLFSANRLEIRTLR